MPINQDSNVIAEKTCQRKHGASGAGMRHALVVGMNRNVSKSSKSSKSSRAAASRAAAIIATRESLAANVRNGNRLAAEGDREALRLMGVTVC